jgi:hypothetical protein
MKAKYCSPFIESQDKIINQLDSLYEGLIKSYPIDKMLASLAYKIGPKNYKIEFISNFNNALPYVRIIIKNKNLDSSIISLFKVGGWELADKETESDTKLVFRAKYDTEVDSKYWPPFLYHITPIENINKIKKNGLIPKAYNKKIKHEDAIYFYNSNNIEDLKHIAYQLYRETYYNDFVVLKIDLRCKKNIDNPILKERRFRLYADPDMNNAYFTKENISPDDIEIIEEFKIGKT